MADKEIYNIDIEKHCLASLIKYPEIISDICVLAKENHFYSDINRTIFSSIISLHDSKNVINRVTIVNYLRNINITHVDNISISDYIEGLSFLHDVNKEAVNKYFSELFKLFIARRVCTLADNLKKDVRKNLNKPVDILISQAEKSFVDCITSNVSDVDDPIDIYETLQFSIENRGEDKNDDGVYVPFDTYRSFYGNFLPGNVYCFIAPFGQGKSTILNAFATQCVDHEKNNCKAIIIDTELETREIEDRIISSETDINEYFIRSGSYKNHEDYSARVKNIWGKLNRRKGKYFHIYAASKPIDSVVSLCRRWKSKHINENEIPIIVYDYLKLTGEQTSDSWKEYQILGEKTSKLNELAKELHAVVLCAVQANADNFVAGSRQILHFASNGYFLRVKTLEEIQDHGTRFGTHILKDYKSRKQGSGARGFSKYIKVKDNNDNETFVENYINLDIKNFQVREMGTLEDVYKNDLDADGYDSDLVSL